MSAFSVWQLSQHSLTPFTFTPHPILLLPIWSIGWAEYRWRWLVFPVCCPFNSRALIFPKCALPWENGHIYLTMGITNCFFFLQKKLVIQGKHIAMHYSNPRPKFEDWLCNKCCLNNFRKRLKCFRCGADKFGKRGFSCLENAIKPDLLPVNPRKKM